MADLLTPEEEKRVAEIRRFYGSPLVDTPVIDDLLAIIDRMRERAKTACVGWSCPVSDTHSIIRDDESIFCYDCQELYSVVPYSGEEPEAVREVWFSWQDDDNPHSGDPAPPQGDAGGEGG